EIHVYKFGTLGGTSLPLISFSISKINQHTKNDGFQEDSICSCDERQKCESLLVKWRLCWGHHPEQSQGDIHNSTCHLHTDSSQGERCEPVINLTSFGAKKNISQADERNYQNEERSFSGSKNSRERSLSPVSDADSSTDSYHGSPPDDQHKKIASVSIGYGEAITKLTKMVEEKDAQIPSLINKWEAHQDKEPSQDTNKKGPHHEAESSEK
ncbi:hypothetical protein GBA52_014948, partial [Prunus armeniaca]